MVQSGCWSVSHRFCIEDEGRKVEKPKRAQTSCLEVGSPGVSHKTSIYHTFFKKERCLPEEETGEQVFSVIRRNVIRCGFIRFPWQRMEELQAVGVGGA